MRSRIACDTYFVAQAFKPSRRGEDAMQDSDRAPTLEIPPNAGRGQQDRPGAEKTLAGGKGATRASLVNLAVYSEDAGSLNTNTQALAKITENHACRAIVIEADCKAQETRVEAWISAHCHVSSVGSKQVCSEQISFLLKGGCTSLAAKHSFFAFGFRFAVLSLVAGRVP